MPSLHKRPESPYWVASFQGASGRWLKKSTKTPDRSLALKMALEWEKAAKAGRKGQLVESQCRKVISEIVEQATGSPLAFHSCREWFNEWIAGKTGTTAERTLLKYRQITTGFLDHLGGRANVPLGAINQKDIRSYRDTLAATGLSPATVNQTVRKVLSAPFSAALRMGYITVNPCAGVEALKDDASTEKDTFTPEQVLALYRVAEGDWQGVILTGYCTGLRLGDIVNLEWQAIDTESGIIRVKTKKTGATVTIPLSSDLLQWLEGRPRGIGKAPVFPSLAGKSGSGKSGLSMQFKRIMEKAGIRGRILRARQGEGAGREQSSLSFHSLRHSFNSALANAGVSQEMRQKLTGHTTAAMNNRYTHHEMDSLRAAMEKLPSVMGGL